jgi:hypothetical protein
VTPKKKENAGHLAISIQKMMKNKKSLKPAISKCIAVKVVCHLLLLVG